MSGLRAAAFTHALVALLHGTWAGVVSSDDGGGGDGEGGDPVFGSPRQHALLVMLAGVRGADAGGPRGGAFLQGLGSAVVLLPRVDTRARVWAGRRRGVSGVDVHKGLGFAILVFILDINII